MFAPSVELLIDANLPSCLQGCIYLRALHAVCALPVTAVPAKPKSLQPVMRSGFLKTRRRTKRLRFP